MMLPCEQYDSSHALPLSKQLPAFFLLRLFYSFLFERFHSSFEGVVFFSSSARDCLVLCSLSKSNTFIPEPMLGESLCAAAIIFVENA